MIKKEVLIFVVLIIAVGLFITAFKANSQDVVTDYDGNQYHTISLANRYGSKKT
jgi:hypothetical protein